VNRRELLRLLAVAVPALAGLSAEQLAALERDAYGSRRRRRGLFDPQQFETVDQLSEIIIPATTTPGAHAAGVAVFIERMVADWYHEDERVAFLAGLADVNARSMRASGRMFLDASAEEQMALVRELDAEAVVGSDRSSTPFFRRFKALTLYGYYTSEVGVQDELKTPFMPGFYHGDVPIGAAPDGSH
jgi:hypothetical protein